MSSKKVISKLVSAIADLKEDEALKIIRHYLEEHKDPNALMVECQEGLKLVGKRYENQEYYLSGLVMGGEIFREITELINASLSSTTTGNLSGKVLLGTVAGDIHDLGKNIVKMLLSCENFSVVDLGVDVPPSEFLMQINIVQPDIIGLSGLMTSAFDSMRHTINFLRKANCKIPVIIGGNLLNVEIFNYIGADYWVTDAYDGLAVCKNLVGIKA